MKEEGGTVWLESGIEVLPPFDGEMKVGGIVTVYPYVVAALAREADAGALAMEVVARTLDMRVAEESAAQWGPAEDGFELSVLGFINGILPALTGMVLVRQTDDETGETVGWSVKEKWW